MHPSSEASSEVPQTVPFVTLSNSLLTNEVAQVVQEWRNPLSQLTNYSAMIRIEKIVKEYREDLYK